MKDQQLLCPPFRSKRKTKFTMSINCSRLGVKLTFHGRNSDVLEYLNDFLRLADLTNNS